MKNFILALVILGFMTTCCFAEEAATKDTAQAPAQTAQAPAQTAQAPAQEAPVKAKRVAKPRKHHHRAANSEKNSSK